MSSPAGFDRLRPRTPTGRPGPRPDPGSGDADGRRALFSTTSTPSRPLAGILVRCSACEETSVLTPGRALRVLVPSLHLPLLRPRYPSLLVCPACRRMTWTRLSVRLRSP